MSRTLTIGTRGSALALVQTHWVRDQLQAAFPFLDIHVLILQTHGDATQAANVPLSSFGEKGVFAKELETALLSGEIDLAVHSMKDLAGILPPGLTIAAVPERQDVRDVLVGKTLSKLQPGDRVGTCSVRRRALLTDLRPDLQIVDIRGNVDTRIGKLRSGQYDSIVLAAAGLNRLTRSGEIAEFLDPETFIPDPGQGALAIEAREVDEVVLSLLRTLDHLPSSTSVRAERTFLSSFGGGCQTPVGAWARIVGDDLIIDAMAALDGAKPRIVRITGYVSEPEQLGKKAAELLFVPRSLSSR